jgi:hypothetical protein
VLTIGLLASYAGVSVRTVRHYHAKGLLPEPQRDERSQGRRTDDSRRGHLMSSAPYTHYRISCYKHQFSLAPFGVTPVLDPARPADLIQLTENDTALIVLTGIASGDVDLDVWRERPDSGDEVHQDGWEQWQSVSMLVEAPLVVQAPQLDEAPVPVFTPSPPGWYRVAVSARGRDLAYDAHVGFDADPIESYGLSFHHLSG